MPPTQAQILDRITPAVTRDLLRRGIKVQNAAKRLLSGSGGQPKRVDTGNLRSSIRTSATTYRGSPAVRVGTNVRYAMWVHDGTGLFGPRRRLIRPRVASVLAFRPRGSRRTVFARYVRGMRRNQFLLRALPAAKDGR